MITVICTQADSSKKKIHFCGQTKRDYNSAKTNTAKNIKYQNSQNIKHIKYSITNNSGITH